MTLVKMIGLYKTWRLAMLDRGNLLSGRIRHVLRDGTQILVRAKTGDIGKINSIYIWKDYHEYLDKIKCGSTVIDIGAHIGVFSIFANKFAKNITIYSYEPFDENFALLEENIRLNGIGDSVHAARMGISGKKGARKLFLNKTNPGESSIFYKTDAYMRIETISLRDVFDENRLNRCDFLKMDCEGMEYEILYNTPIGYLNRIESISMEFHDNGDIVELIKFLKNNGFEVVSKRMKDHLLYAKRRN